MDLKLEETLSHMILSASGWRGIFAESGDEEDPSPAISEAHKIIAATAAKVFSDCLSSTGKGAVIVGRDTRPTGEAIADVVIRVLLSGGRVVRYLGIAAAPEIMAFARCSGIIDATPLASAGASGGNNPETLPAAGFVYISASHNPIGHNGIKFGLTDGGVLAAGESGQLISAFNSLINSPNWIEQIRSLLSNAGTENLAGVYTAAKDFKKSAVEAYRNFSMEVISGLNDRAKSNDFFMVLQDGLKKRPVGIAADFNGSARTVSIDRDFFSSLGIKFRCINDEPGKIAHRIVPEGVSLEPCRAFLEELHGKDPSFVLGYTPDCDGDRGNLVIWDDREQRARILEAQEVFALACVAELSSLVRSGELTYDSRGKALVRAALAVNDPTSLRIDRIAGFFDVSVFRAEVGEANVVGLARKLREDGYLVRILGEGSAGGTIIHPSAVRDPIDTLGAILKLLALRADGKGLYETWCCLSGHVYNENFTLSDIIASLPAFVTTGAYTDDALLRVKTADHGLLKERYQKIFVREWEEKKKELSENYGISEWEAVAYNGMEEKRGLSRFSDAGRGGLKIIFKGNSNSRGKAGIACIWMRGSATEPVFRVMADAADHADPAGLAFRLERTLIEWQRRMVLEADNE